MANGYDDQSNVRAETAIKHYVDQNALSATNIKRIIPNLVIKGDQLRGNLISVRGRFQTVLELVNAICLSGDVGFETTFNESLNQNEFDIIEGLDRTSSQSVNDPVTFSPSFGNIKTIDFEESLLTLKNMAYVAGQGEADNRILREVFSGVEPSGYDRKEVFIDARDLVDSAELDNRGETVLNDNKEQLFMSFTYLDTGLFQYLDDFNLGDDVTVEYTGIGSLDATIIMVKESYAPENGQTISIGIGRDFPDIYKVIKDDIQNLQPEQRR